MTPVYYPIPLTFFPLAISPSRPVREPAVNAARFGGAT